MRDDDSALPRNFVRTVRSLQHLLLSAVLERKAALAKEFRDCPPLRPFGDVERLGVPFPVMTPETWKNFMDTCAEDTTIINLKLVREAAVGFGEHVSRIVTQRAGIEEQCDQLRNEYHTRAGASADDPHDHARDARVARAHRAWAELQASRPAAMEDLESRFGAGDAPLPPLPLRSKADFFDDELDAQFGPILRNLVREETYLVETWEREFRKELAALEQNLLGPSFSLEGNRVDVMPNPWMGDTDAILAQERSYSEVHAGKKEMLKLQAHLLETLHSKVVLGKLREGLANGAYEFRTRTRPLVDEAGDGAGDVSESAVLYESRVLRVIKLRYKNALETDIVRHKSSPLIASTQFRYLQTMEDVEAHIKAEIETPLSEEALNMVRVATANASAQYNALAPLLVQDVAAFSPTLALHDGLSNRCLEAYFVRSERDANSELYTTSERFNADLLQLLLSSPWHNNNHRGSVGIDEGTTRVHRWLATSAHTNHSYGSLDATKVYMSRPPVQVDENRTDPNRPMHPYGTSYSSLPSLDAATKVSVAASMRRMMVPAR